MKRWLSKMGFNLLFIARNYPPRHGGAERLNFDLATRFLQKINVTLVANRHGRYSLVFLIIAVYKMIQLRRQVDVVFLSDGMLAPLASLAKILGMPVVMKVHGLDVTYANRFYQLMIQRYLPKIPQIVCISNATKEECLKRGAAPGSCSVIPIGIDAEGFGENLDRGKAREDLERMTGLALNEHEVILSMGRLVKRKGFGWFLDNVFETLVEQRKNLIYVIGGTGPLLPELDQKIKRKGLEKKVILAGSIDEQVLSTLYSAADLFIMPNIVVPGDMEGFGIVLLEAGACGLPAVAADIEGISDVIQIGKNGILVTSGDAAGFATGISRLLDNRYDAAEVRSYVSGKFDWSEIVEIYLDEFEKAKRAVKTR